MYQPTYFKNAQLYINVVRRQLKYYSFLCLAERLLISCSFDRNIFPEQFRLMGRIRLPIMPETLYFQKFKASRNWEKSVFIQIYLTITSKNFSWKKFVAYRQRRLVMKFSYSAEYVRCMFHTQEKRTKILQLFLGILSL